MTREELFFAESFPYTVRRENIFRRDHKVEYFQYPKIYLLLNYSLVVVCHLCLQQGSELGYVYCILKCDWKTSQIEKGALVFTDGGTLILLE